MKSALRIHTKILCIVLSVVLTAGLLPVGAFAQDEVLDVPAVVVEQPDGAGQDADGDLDDADALAESESGLESEGEALPVDDAVESELLEGEETQEQEALGEEAPTPEDEALETQTLEPLSKEVSAEWPSFRGNDRNNGVVSFDLPADPSESTLLWSKRMGTSYVDAASIQLIVDNCLVFLQGLNIYKVDLLTGDVIAKGNLAARYNWGNTPFAYGEGKIFVALGGSKVQAFDASTLQSLWVYTDKISGQAISPVVYSDGYVYTGFWAEDTADANYVCLKAADEDPKKTDESKSATWTITSKGGFYWTGGVAIGDYLVFGSNSGTTAEKGASSTLRCVNKYTGELVSSLTLSGLGDQRSSIVYEPSEGKIYFTTRYGYICSASFNASTGSLKNLKSSLAWDGSASTCTPVYYKGRLYFGVGTGPGCSPGCRLIVADASSLRTIASVQALGDVKGAPLLSTATEDLGYLCVYFTYNNGPGGISLAKIKVDCESNDDIELVELYDAAIAPQYNICSLIASSAGVMYMKNDSGTIFAVGFSEDGRKAADQRRATSFQQTVDALLPITLESGPALEAAWAKYNGLSAGARALVPQSVVDKLNGAQEQYDTLVADNQVAQEFTAAVEALFPVTMESGDAIVAARAQADALTPGQRALVSSDTFAKLSRAEAEYQALLEEDPQVRDVILAIAALFPVTLDSGAAIAQVQEMMDGLTSEQKRKLPKVVLQSYQDAKDQYQQLLADKAVADSFVEQVARLGKITLESGNAIAAAEATLKGLTPSQRSMVPEATLTKLSQARSQYDQLVADKKAVDRFVSMVSSLGTITLESGGAIRAAEAARDALTPTQLAQVPAATLASLKDARSTYDKLEEGKEAATKVAALINDLGVITLQSGDAIAAAEAALAALSPEARSLMPADILAKLERARKNYDALKAAAEEEENEKTKKEAEASGATKQLGEDGIQTEAAALAEIEEELEEIIYTALLVNAPLLDEYAQDEGQQFPWVLLIVGGVALLVLGIAGRMKLALEEDEDEENDGE